MARAVALVWLGRKLSHRIGMEWFGQSNRNGLGRGEWARIGPSRWGGPLRPVEAGLVTMVWLGRKLSNWHGSGWWGEVRHSGTGRVVGSRLGGSNWDGQMR